MQDPIRKKLLYRAMHRGFKEADIVLGTFAERNLEKLTDKQLQTFEVLLETPDRELYAWIMKHQETPEEYQSDVMEMLQNFSVIEEGSSITKALKLE